MDKIATATVQTIWGCRWSRPGPRVTGVQHHLQPKSLWVCVRTVRRATCLKDCADCPHWEKHQSPSGSWCTR